MHINFIDNWFLQDTKSRKTCLVVNITCMIESNEFQAAFLLKFQHFFHIKKRDTGK